MTDFFQKALDMDLDEGLFGVRGDDSGQMAMRVAPNAKCDGCLHYASQDTACRIGMIPTVCGDGSYPDMGYAPSHTDSAGATAFNDANDANVRTPGVEAMMDDVRTLNAMGIRIDVLGDSALQLSMTEQIDIVKAAVFDYDMTDPDEILRATGVQVRIGESKLISKSTTLPQFADAMGTTVEVVQAIARRLGDPAAFATFVKSKLPDIRRAWGLTDTDVAQIFKAAVELVKSQSPTEWEVWKGISFEPDVSDSTLAQAIETNGLLDINAIYGDTILRDPPDPVRSLEEPRPVQSPEQQPLAMAKSFVGGVPSSAADIMAGYRRR